MKMYVISEDKRNQLVEYLKKAGTMAVMELPVEVLKNLDEIEHKVLETPELSEVK